MISDIHKDAESRMKKSVEALHNELSKIRTGRAHPTLLEHVKVEYYGSDVPLNQVANITATDARTLTVTPWEKNMVGPIEKAIMQSDLGLNPATVGQTIRVPLPALTEERRKELLKVLRSEAEKSRVAIRNVRRDAIAHFKELLKEKSISEDEEHRAQDDIQKLTDRFCDGVDEELAKREKDVMSV